MRIDLTTGTIHCPRCKRTRTFPTLQRLKQWRRVHLRGCTPPEHLPPAAHIKRAWTAADDAVLLDNPSYIAARILHRSPEACRTRRQKLNDKKAA